MSIKSFSISICILLIISACDIDDERSFTESPSTVENVVLLDTISVNEKLAIDIIHTGNACDHYSRYTVVMNDFSAEVVVFNKRDKDTTCSLEIFSMQTTIELQFSKVGMHKLYFRQSDTRFLIDSVFVIGN